MDALSVDAPAAVTGRRDAIADRGGAPTVVSLTPVALDSDGRALRFAHSLARAGYRSIVVEGAPSKAPQEFGLPVVSLETRAPIAAQQVVEPSQRQPATPLARLRAGSGHALIDHGLAAGYRLQFCWRYVIRARRHVPPADLYLLHGFLFYPLVKWLGGRRSPCFLYDAHDFYSAVRPAADLPEFDRRHVEPFLQGIERACCRDAAAVTTVSDGVADLMAERFHRRPLVLRNLQDVRIEPFGGDARPALPGGLRERLALGRDCVLIVVIGNCKTGQAVQTMLMALAKTPAHVHVAFVGAGYERFAAAAQSLGVGQRAHFPGPMPSHRLLSFVAGADAAAVIYLPHTPNSRAALPNGFFQAIAAGLPVIVGKGLPEVVRVVRDCGLGIEIDPADADDVAAAMARLAGDKDLCATLRGAVAAARPKLLWQCEEARLVELARTVLADALPARMN